MNSFIQPVVNLLLNNKETFKFASELLENLEDVFLRNFMHMNMPNIFKSSNLFIKFSYIINIIIYSKLTT